MASLAHRAGDAGHRSRSSAGPAAQATARARWGAGEHDGSIRMCRWPWPRSRNTFTVGASFTRRATTITKRRPRSIAGWESIRWSNRSLPTLPRCWPRPTRAVCRAGGTTLAELAVSGVPAVLVPYPYAADDHQRKNAEVYTSAGACLLLDQREVTGPPRAVAGLPTSALDRQPCGPGNDGRSNARTRLSRGGCRHCGHDSEDAPERRPVAYLSTLKAPIGSVNSDRGHV